MMDEMLEQEEAPEGDGNPRLEAIMELLKFLSKSEANRAMPPPEAAPAPEALGGAGGEPDPDELEALKALAR